MPKLLQINVTANLGSTGKIAEFIGLCAQNSEWESYIAYGRMMNPSKNKLIKIGSKMDNYIHYVGNCLLDMEGRCSNWATKALIKQISDIQPDVVQLHNIHDHYLNYELLFKYLNITDIKVVWTFHDCWAFTGHCYHFIQQDCMKWRKECNTCPQRNMFVDRSRKNFLLKKSLFTSNKNLTIVSCSEWMGDFVRKSFLKDKSIHIIKNGVDIETFSPTISYKNAKRGNNFKILAVSSSWNPGKGELDIYKLRHLLNEKDYMITMVGLTANQIRNLPKGIVGIQRIQNVQELVQLYSDADIFINPTYADTFPTVNLEALACGTPVITYNTGGSPEAIDKKTGIVIRQGDVEGLTEAIIQLKNNMVLYSVNCRKRAETYFDKNKCFEQYIQLYNKLIDRD